VTTRISNAATSAAPTLAQARKTLQDVFGYGAFRPGQQEVIEAVLARRDTLAVMPTGGGKSVCFQVPELLFEDGLTLVVSPVLALMKDQVDALRSSGVAAAAINSTVSADDQQAILRDAATGKLQLLYVAPERFGNGSFMAALRGLRVALLAVDEAHCISQWGHDFRPSYRDLGSVRGRIGDVPIVALTATADPRVRADIVERLALREPVVHVAGFDRPNLRFDVERVTSKKVKAERIAEKLRELKDESAIVYCGTRKNVEELTDYLQAQRIKSARYHAGMPDQDRKRIQDAFARDSLRIIVATNAFGMGIDKPDVRLVLHHDMTDSLESYYQEAGRAGRDGAPAECVLYFGSRDRQLRDFFIEMSHPEPQRVIEVYRDLVAYSGQRVHVRELMHTDDEPGVNAAIQALVESGLAARQGFMVSATRPGGENEIDTAGLEAHRQHAIAKVDAMQRYAESRTCLRARILDYFGDSEHAVSCGNCGPCIAPPVTARQVASEAEEELFQQLRAVRRRFAEEGSVPPFVIFSDATLRDMASLRPRSRSEMLNVSGVGRVKYEKYGEAFLAVTRGGNAPAAPLTRPAAPARDSSGPGTKSTPGKLTTSLRDTLELYEDGLDIEQIAKQRGFAPSTIATHLAQLIHFGHITDTDSLITPGLIERVREVSGPGPVGPLSPLHEALGGDVPYEQLHLARAWLNRPA
jgi:ATP-dependent DNA helicase RecQ